MKVIIYTTDPKAEGLYSTAAKRDYPDDEPMIVRSEEELEVALDRDPRTIRKVFYAGVPMSVSDARRCIERARSMQE